LGTQAQNVVTGSSGRTVDGLGGPVTEHCPFGMLPQMVHCIQLRCCPREQPQFDGAGVRHPPAAGAGMLRRSVLEEDDIPAPPMAADHVEKVLVLPLGPVLGHQQLDITRTHVDRPMQNPAGMAAADRDTHLLPDMPVTAVQRRRLGNDRFVKHQEDCPLALGKAVF